MTTRKDEIIQTSIILFNQKGCINTSTRHIADELGISVGNLYYYFKNKEEIIITIYEIFMEEVTSHVTSLKDGFDVAFDYYKFLIDQMQYELKYRFLRMEMNNLISKYSKVKIAFEKGMAVKLEQMRNMFLHQIKYGYLKKLDERELDFLVSNTWILITQWEIFWVLNNVQDEKKRREYGILNLLYFEKPYLTKKGLEQSNLLDSILYLEKELQNVT